MSIFLRFVQDDNLEHFPCSYLSHSLRLSPSFGGKLTYAPWIGSKK